MKDFTISMAESCACAKITRLTGSPVIGSDLIPLKKIPPKNMTSFNKKRERQKRHMREMLRKYMKSDDPKNGKVSAILELATSEDIINATLLELWKQVIKSTFIM